MRVLRVVNFQQPDPELDRSRRFCGTRARGMHDSAAHTGRRFDAQARGSVRGPGTARLRVQQLRERLWLRPDLLDLKARSESGRACGVRSYLPLVLGDTEVPGAQGSYCRTQHPLEAAARTSLGGFHSWSVVGIERANGESFTSSSKGVRQRLVDSRSEYACSFCKRTCGHCCKKELLACV